MKPEIIRVGVQSQWYGQPPSWRVDYLLAGAVLTLTVPMAADAIEARQKAERLLRLN